MIENTVGKIKVVKKGSPQEPESIRIYCGRGSPLGNPHVMRDHSEAERTRVCELFEETFKGWIRIRDEAPVGILHRILRLLLAGANVELECYCAPKRCHVDYIKKRLERRLVTLRALKQMS